LSRHRQSAQTFDCNFYRCFALILYGQEEK
jgi:hypothetical protein